MVDQELSDSRLLGGGTILVLVGDDIVAFRGPGNVLRSRSGASPFHGPSAQSSGGKCHHPEFHRINRGSGLGEMSRQISSSSDRRRRQIADLIVQMALKLKARDANFQVLSQSTTGRSGQQPQRPTARRSTLSEHEEGRSAGAKFEGDRLMVVKNDTTWGSTTATWGSSWPYARTTSWSSPIPGKTGSTCVRIPQDVVQKLRLAYAITTSQGSEFDTVICPWSRHGRMLQHNLFYTA